METKKRKQGPPPTLEQEEERSKHQKKENTTTRNWADLHEPLLVSILHHLPSITDLFSFSFVCRSFYSLATSPSTRPSFSTFPPLIFKPDQPRHIIQSLTSTSPSTLLLPRLPFETLSSVQCAGSSYGHLIFPGQYPFLADVFTGDITPLPHLPDGDKFIEGRAILTAPLSSSSSMLILTSRVDARESPVPSLMRYWSRGSSEWKEIDIENLIYIQSMVVFKERVCILCNFHCLVVIELAPSVTWKSFDYLPIRPTVPYSNFGSFMVECGGQLLVVFLTSVRGYPITVKVFQLDFVKYEWVRVGSLGNWCLFVDAVGSCAVSCPNPTRWGGRRNCVYVAGAGFQT